MTTTSPARDRLLDTAVRLFYAEGIHAVGVDRLVDEARVTRATFYRHFPSKDDLVAAYLDQVDRQLREAVTATTAQSDRRRAVDALVNLIGRTVCSTDFRGCHFINAAAEYPDPQHPVREAIDRHRAWFSDLVTELAGAAGHPDPRYAGRVLVLLHDGALAGGELDNTRMVRTTLRRAVHDLFAAHLKSEN